MKTAIFEKANHENSKKGNIQDIEAKIQEIRELSRDCTDETLTQYYKGYIHAYTDCIDIIQKDKHY